MDGGHEKVPRGLAGRVAPAGGSRIARLPRRPPFRGGYSAAVGSLLASESPTAQGIRGQAERRPGRFPQRFRGMIRGRPACWRIPALWCWDIRLPASFPQWLRGMIRGRPACWRIPALWCWDIRLPASFPQRLRGRSVGDQHAGESGPPVLGYSLASKLPTAVSW